VQLLNGFMRARMRPLPNLSGMSFLSSSSPQFRVFFVGMPTRPQDIVQAAFLRAYRSFAGYRGGGYPRLDLHDCAKLLSQLADGPAAKVAFEDRSPRRG